MNRGLIVGNKSTHCWGFFFFSSRRHYFVFSSHIKASPSSFIFLFLFSLVSLLVRGQRSNKLDPLSAEAPWEPPRLAWSSDALPSFAAAAGVSARRRHILHGGVAARNKVRQENLTGIFLFVPEFSVQLKQPPPHHLHTPATRTKRRCRLSSSSKFKVKAEYAPRRHFTVYTDDVLESTRDKNGNERKRKIWKNL